MQNSKPQLKIYTHSPTQEPPADATPAHPFALRWPKAGAKRLARKKRISMQSARRKLRPRLSAMEKLVRNAAVACALMLCALAVQNINQPWAQNATSHLKRVLTMRIDLDESLGRLNFVRGLVPDTAQVFWQMGSKGKLQPPVDGVITHEYAKEQPWTEFLCATARSIVAAEAGTVAAVMQGEKGDWTLLLDHESGAQTVYAYMAQALAKPGDRVSRGAQIGVSADDENSRLYFELRKDGLPADPALGL